MPKQSLDPRSDCRTNLTIVTVSVQIFKGETEEAQGTALYSKPWFKPVHTEMAKAISTMLLFGSLPEYNSFETKKHIAV